MGGFLRSEIDDGVFGWMWYGCCGCMNVQGLCHSGLKESDTEVWGPKVANTGRYDLSQRHFD